MRDVADHWYSSGTFLGVAGIAAAVVFGVLGVWAAFRAANPRRELTWQICALVPLLNDQAGVMHGAVQVQLDGKPLECPTVMEVSLSNRSRHDIPTAAFDQGRPLRVDVGAPIVRHLVTDSDPERFRIPRIVIEDCAFTLGPDLLKKGQSVKISLLLDGGTPFVTVPEPPFIDVEVRQELADSETPRKRPAMVALAAAAIVAGWVTEAVMPATALKTIILAAQLAGVVGGSVMVLIMVVKEWLNSRRLATLLELSIDDSGAHRRMGAVVSEDGGIPD